MSDVTSSACSWHDTVCTNNKRPYWFIRQSSAKAMLLISVKMCFRRPGRLCFVFIAASLCLTALIVIRSVRQDWDKNGEWSLTYFTFFRGYWEIPKLRLNSDLSTTQTPPRFCSLLNGVCFYVRMMLRKCSVQWFVLLYCRKFSATPIIRVSRDVKKSQTFSDTIKENREKSSDWV